MKTQNITEIQPNVIIGEDHIGWINLPAWKGFRTEDSRFDSLDSEPLSDGIIKTHTIGVSVDYVYLLSQAQYNAIQYLAVNSELVRDSLLNSLFDDYSNKVSIYKELMPQVTEIGDYKNHLGLSFLHIMDNENDDFAYYGFELECSWDIEHGVGVMMHKDRVIKVGLAEESFNHLNTIDNRGTSVKTTLKKKKWWEYWK